MSRYILMADQSTGRVSVFLEDNNIGHPHDPNSERNAPLNNPVPNWGKIRFHSDFFYYLVHSITDVSITHQSGAGGTTEIVQGLSRAGTIANDTQTLVTHSLGYVPAYMIVSNGALISPTSIIQTTSDNGMRSITPYATTSQIRLRDFIITGSAGMSSISRNYTVIVFRSPVEDSPYLIDFDHDNNHIELGRGRFKGNLKALRRSISGDSSSFDIALGRTIDIRNGGSKTVLPDGTVYTDSIYNGSFSGSASIQCTVE